jgi:hypothetical protein
VVVSSAEPAFDRVETEGAGAGGSFSPAMITLTIVMALARRTVNVRRPG